MDVLFIKYDLGLRIFSAYRSRNRKELTAILSDCDALVEKIEVFYADFQKQWKTDNKGHGFDVQDIRIGGLIQRVKHCRDILEWYSAGQLDTIEELEEEKLDFFGGQSHFHKQPLAFNNYADIVSVNRL